MSELFDERTWNNQRRAHRRRALYESDPVYRLTKLKDNRERRLRGKLRATLTAAE